MLFKCVPLCLCSCVCAADVPYCLYMYMKQHLLIHANLSLPLCLRTQAKHQYSHEENLLPFHPRTLPVKFSVS